MKLGITEILLIGLVIVIVISASRFLPARTRPNTEASHKQLTTIEAQDEMILRARRSKGKIMGYVLVIIGVILVMAAPNLIRAFFMSYLWGTLIIIAGLASLFFLSRRS